jgi:two-component system chemotaxis response regulator CheB
MIRVLLVDDSPIELHILQRLLSQSSEIQVVGTAADGREALELVRSLNPDVICTDLYMPVMDGLEFTREVMANYPRPILAVSVAVEPGSPNIFRLLEAGAVDVYSKPHDILNGNMDKLAHELASKIRILAGVHVFRRNHTARGASVAKLAPKPAVIPRPKTPVRIVVIGASTGGPQALHQILAHLPASFPVPILCVQHIGSNFLSEMVKWLAKVSPLPVRKAMQGETPQAGTVYFAPEDAHLELDDGARFALSPAAPLDGHRPSVTITMCAAARCFGAGAVGVLLTGMGSDGAAGMASIAAAGGITIAQDEASSVVFGMPQQAVKLGAVQHILPLDQIAPALEAMLNAQSAGWNKSNADLTIRGME